MTAFVACTARSGSTLLRRFLDAHPDVACPPEMNLCAWVEAQTFSAKALSPANPGGMWARRAIDSMLYDYLAERGKKVWVDKSLSNALSLDLIAQTWKGAPFLFLHRHVMGFIASALDAQPWGPVNHGFGAYVSGGDVVGGLSRYWLERTAKMLDFCSRTGHRTAVIRYEDLCSDPQSTLAGVWGLLGVDAPESLQGAFEALTNTHGNADHLTWWTDGVHEAQDGRRIPPERVANLPQVNECLSELGYPLVDDGWGSGGVPRGTPLVVVDREAIAGLISGELNIGHALRQRMVRYYGPALDGYGAELEMFSDLPKRLAEMD